MAGERRRHGNEYAYQWPGDMGEEITDWRDSPWRRLPDGRVVCRTCGDDEWAHNTWCGGYTVRPRGDYLVRYAARGYWADFPDFLVCDRKGRDAGSAYALEHRIVAWETYGAGPLPCVWCGRMLVWGKRDPNPDEAPTTIQVDHLDNDKTNPEPWNLVISCARCNIARAHRILHYTLRHDPEAVPNWALMAIWAQDKTTFERCGCPFEEANILNARSQNPRHQRLICLTHERERTRLQNRARRQQRRQAMP